MKTYDRGYSDRGYRETLERIQNRLMSDILSYLSARERSTYIDFIDNPEVLAECKEYDNGIHLAYSQIVGFIENKLEKKLEE